MDETPKIMILLATRNGEPFLREQLDSILQQTCGDLKIVASDDGSTDKTLQILQEYSIPVFQGPQKGFAANFLSLIEKAKDTSEFYAFTDQDDVWKTTKLERAMAHLSTIDSDIPALYCSRTMLVDESLNPVGHSPLFNKTPGFLNALVQNIGGGNTMVFNQAAFKLLRQTKNKYHIVSHDWWAYLLISGADGVVIYDSEPSLYYRQHKNNIVGSNNSWKARIYRIHHLFRGRLKLWINQNNQDLLDVAHLLKAKHRHELESFELARKKWFAPRVIHFMQLGIYRQTLMGQIGLFIGSLCNKI